MAVTTRALHTSAAHRPTTQVHLVRAQLSAAGRYPPTVLLPAPPLPRAARVAAHITTLLTLAALILVLPQLIQWAQTMRDDLQYGRPRTTMLRAFVGHDEARGAPTQLVALNLNRQVVVLELPGGDPAHARLLQGPYLFGAQEHLTPIHLQLAQINADGALDLVVSIKHEEIIYMNEQGAFRLITPEERMAYRSALEERGPHQHPTPDSAP